MLNGISPLLSPLMLKTLCEMGHGDTLVIADGNFPAESVGRNAVVIRYDGQDALPLLKAILSVFPLDGYVDAPVTLMAKVPGDEDVPTLWDEFAQAVSVVDGRGAAAIGMIDRFPFYDEARKAYCIIATGERTQYANIILRKGVVRQP